jgi:hypothetical protein
MMPTPSSPTTSVSFSRRGGSADGSELKRSHDSQEFANPESMGPEKLLEAMLPYITHGLSRRPY